MTIRAESLGELLKIFPADAIVRGFADGLAIMNADGTGEVLVLNDGVGLSAKATSESYTAVPGR